MRVDVEKASEGPPVHPRQDVSSNQASERRDKLLDIERGKGIGIALVVYGHLVMAGTLGEQYWYQITKSSIYLFHMPFFMYLSGFVFFHTDAHLSFSRHYAKFVGKRFDRLLVPFFALALIIVLGKALSSRAMHIDDGVSGMMDGISAIFTNAPDNPSISIWYLIVLFVYSILTPVIWSLVGGRLSILLLIAIVIHFLPAEEAFYAGRIMRFYVFFVCGMLAARYMDKILQSFTKYLPWFSIVFAVLLYIGRDLPHALLWCGIASIPVIHGLVRLPIFQNDRILSYIGKNSMVIYLLNTIFIGLAKGVYVKFLPYHGPWFGVMVGTLMFFGLLGPILTKYILARVPLGDYVYKYVR